jgi:hypothetical protein
MQIPILVEPVAKHDYRATCGPPLAVSADGATRDEAVGKLEPLLCDRPSNGVEIVVAEVPARLVENAWVKYAGRFKDDPMFAEVLEVMKENRRKDDEDPGPSAPARSDDFRDALQGHYATAFEFIIIGGTVMERDGASL